MESAPCQSVDRPPGAARRAWGPRCLPGLRPRLPPDGVARHAVPPGGDRFGLPRSRAGNAGRSSPSSRAERADGRPYGGCQQCRGRASKRTGGKAQRTARKLLAVPVTSSIHTGHEEFAGGLVRFECKSGAQVGPLITAFTKAEKQSGKPVAVLQPDRARSHNQASSTNRQNQQALVGAAVS